MKNERITWVIFNAMIALVFMFLLVTSKTPDNIMLSSVGVFVFTLITFVK